MFGLSKKEKIIARENQRKVDELEHIDSMFLIEKSPLGNTFLPKDNYCYNCGSKLHLYTRYIDFDTQTGRKIRHVYKGCPKCLPYNKSSIYD